MRKQIILPFLVYTLMSCSSGKVDVEQCPEKWQLIEMTGNISNVPPSVGSNMTWQEWYLLYPNSTFTKTRERDNVIKEETGTYAIVTLSDGKYLELEYKAKNDLVGNCTSEAKELLKINSENEMIGTWLACDGPGLLYKKVDNNCLTKTE